MCGISGLVNCGDRETLARMTDVQAHRGPDDAGFWEQKFPDGSYVGLGSRRLSVIDLSTSGHMPMCNEDRTVWITYNGEIYTLSHTTLFRSATSAFPQKFLHSMKSTVHELSSNRGVVQ